MELSVKDRLLEELEKVESYQRLYPDTYVDKLIKAGVTIRSFAEWVDGCCSVCGAYIPTDHRRDYISEDEVNFCYYCGSMDRRALARLGVVGEIEDEDLD